ncbi:MICOS complex subunit MIC13 [Varanus komodoensis]|nr:MICOS complex subunit MIC13 [Varanus komodoensis]
MADQEMALVGVTGVAVRCENCDMFALFPQERQGYTCPQCKMVTLLEEESEATVGLQIPKGLARPAESGAGGDRAALGPVARRPRCMMAPRVFPLVNNIFSQPASCFLFRFLVKGGLAGGAVYLVYNQGLLSGGEQGAQALRKARDTLPLAVEEWAKYFGWKLPAVPKTEFSFYNYWNSELDTVFQLFPFDLASILYGFAGVQSVIGGLSVAPTRACEYTQCGWKYVKDLTK